MTNCPKCGRPVDKELICRWCAHVLHEAVDPRPDATVTPVKFEPRPQPIVAPPPPAAAAARPKQSRWSPRLIALVVGGVGLLALLAAVTRSPATTPLTATPAESGVKTAATGGDDSAAPVAPLRSDSAPRWIESGPDDRRRTGVNGFVFELSADEDVKVSRKRVRPVLTVRCVAKKTEVFVVTRSPASIEDTGKHTIHVAFDSGDEDTQTWEHSVDHDALFAPDGHTLARQIVGARTMSFAFTPFNSPLAVTTFSVGGFDAEVESAAKKCGWK